MLRGIRLIRGEYGLDVVAGYPGVLVGSGEVDGPVAPGVEAIREGCRLPGVVGDKGKLRHSVKG